MPTNGAATVKWPEERWFKVGEMSKREEAVLYVLQRFYDSQSVNSRTIYDAVGYDGDHETRKRSVRLDIRKLRKKGAPICASIKGGYWLARNATEFAQWQEAEKSKAVFKFVDLRKQAQAVRDGASGQGLLFNDAGDTTAAFSK